MSQAAVSVGIRSKPDWSSQLIDGPCADLDSLVRLADIDSRLREGELKWEAVVRELESARRNLVLANAELQKVRRVAEHQKKAAAADPNTPHQVRGTEAEESRRAHLFEEFEGVLREAEVRRVALHGEMAELRQRKGEAVSRLSGPVRATYHAAEQAGRIPAVGVIVDGRCSGCSSTVPAEAVAAVSRGAVVVCCDCGRLLRILGVS